MAIVVPDPEVLPKWILDNGHQDKPKEEILESLELKKALFEQLDAKVKEYKLSGIERIRKVHITPHAFSV